MSSVGGVHRYALALVLVGLTGCSPAPTKDQQQAKRIEQSFVGGFVGTLERLDAEGIRRVTLPTKMLGTRQGEGGVTLVVEITPEGGSAAGVERVTTRLRVDAVTRELVFSNTDGSAIDRYSIALYSAFTGLGELIITGKGEEEGRAVEVRILYSVGPSTLSWTRGVRSPGGEFKFRQRYTMKRVR